MFLLTAMACPKCLEHLSHQQQPAQPPASPCQKGGHMKKAPCQKESHLSPIPCQRKDFGQSHCRAKFPEKKVGAAGYKDKPNKGAESQPEEGCWLCCCHEKACQEKAKAKSKAKSKKPLPKEIASTTTYPRKKGPSQGDQKQQGAT